MKWTYAPARRRSSASSGPEPEERELHARPEQRPGGLEQKSEIFLRGEPADSADEEGVRGQGEALARGALRGFIRRLEFVGIDAVWQKVTFARGWRSTSRLNVSTDRDTARMRVESRFVSVSMSTAARESARKASLHWSW